MPFTIAHAVLAPPISKLTRGFLPIGALAVGSMTPDLVRFFNVDSHFFHQWNAALFPDTFLGLCFAIFWYLIYRPVLYHFLD